jgi:4'-phosphopantetheinyl transferase
MNRAQIGEEPPFLWCGLPTAELDDRSLARFGNVLDAEEHGRINRLRHVQARRDAIAAHGLRRLLLASLTGRPADSFRFRADRAGGKPKAAGMPGVDVSLTHCDGYAAAAAIGRGGRIGIDAEPLCRPIEPELAAAMTTSFKQGVRGEPIVVWTMQEALTKAEGSGLALNVKRLEIDPCAPRLVTAPESFGDPACWRLERHCHAGFTVAIAVRSHNGR